MTSMWLVDGELVPDCYWDGPRPCSHDQDAPLPKPRPLAGWMSTHDCPQDDGSVGWNGALVEPENANASRAARQRIRRWYDEDGRGRRGEGGEPVVASKAVQRAAIGRQAVAPGRV